MADDDVVKAIERLAEVSMQLHDSTVELRQTRLALQRNHRTPAQIREMLAMARLAVYRSRIIRRALKARFRVH